MTNTPTIIDLSSCELDIMDITHFPDEFNFMSFDDAFDDLLRSANKEIDKTE